MTMNIFQCNFHTHGPWPFIVFCDPTSIIYQYIYIFVMYYTAQITRLDLENVVLPNIFKCCEIRVMLSRDLELRTLIGMDIASS